MLKEKGRYYQLPIEGNTIQKIVYDGLLRIIFNDTAQSYLDLHGEFKIQKQHETIALHPKDQNALLLFHDLFHANVQIKEAKADRAGQLFLTFDNGLELTVEDGPFENWHYTKIDKQHPKNSLYVHGGVGKTIW